MVGISFVQGDLSDESVCQRAIDLAVSKFNRLDGLVLNAAVLDPVKSIADSSVQEWKKLYDVNFFSIVSLLSKSIPHLRGHGKVVFVSSGASTKGYVSVKNKKKDHITTKEE